MSTAPIPTGQPSGKKHRSRSPRRKIEALMYVNLGEENGGFPINISEGGMAFHGVRAMRKDQVLQIKFSLPGLHSSVESAAQIVWLNELGKGGGLQFIGMPEISARLIREWLSLQTSVHTLADTNPIARPAVAMKKLNPVPSIVPAPGHTRSSRNIYSRAVAASGHSPSSPAEAPKIIPAATLAAAAARPAELPIGSSFRNPLLKPETRSIWSVSYPFVLVTGLGLAAFLGLASYQFHWSFEIPDSIPNPAVLFDQPVAATSPRYSGGRQRANVSPAAPASPDAAPSVAAAPAIDPLDSLDAPDVSETPQAAAHPAPVLSLRKKSVPLKMNPPHSASHRPGAITERMPPALAQKSAVADIPPPAVAPPAKPELAAQLPALQAEVSPPAPREPVMASGVSEPAQLVSRKNPVYPPSVRGSGFFGSVELHFTISADGSVRDVTVAKGNLLLAHAAIEAVQAWRYKPARRDGVPVDSESSMTFVFDSN
jgi:periplasmic protein TonB